VTPGALILQRRIRTRRSFSRSARLYSVEPAPHLLSGVKRTWRLHCEMSVYDPKRTNKGGHDR
jgi:hypothetical protein